MKHLARLFYAFLALCLLAACGGGAEGSPAPGAGSASMPASALPPSSPVPGGSSSMPESVPTPPVSSAPSGSSSTSESTPLPLESVSSSEPTSEAKLSYEAYFSEERPVNYHYVRDDDPNRWSLRDDGALVWSNIQLNDVERVAEDVSYYAFHSEVVFYVVNETQLYVAAPDNSWSRFAYECDAPIDRPIGNGDVIFFSSNGTVYRHHIESGITDTFYEAGEYLEFWPYSNFSIFWESGRGINSYGNSMVYYKYYNALTETVTEPPEDYTSRWHHEWPDEPIFPPSSHFG